MTEDESSLRALSSLRAYIIDNKHKSKLLTVSDAGEKTEYSVGWEQVVILNRVVSLDLTEKVSFEQRLKGGEKVSYGDI